MSWLNPNRWDELVSRRDADRVLRDLSNSQGHHHDGDQPTRPWYRNAWVWVSIVLCVLILAWLIAIFL